MIFAPDFYEQVKLGTYEQSICSPAAPSPTWSGVVISAPKQVKPGAGEKPVVPVCGHYVIEVLAAMDGPGLRVHVRRVDTDVVLSGDIVDPAANEPEIPPPAHVPRPKREAFVGITTGGYFNIDAQRYLPVSLLPGSYEVTVSYAGKVSNAVIIEIKPP